MFRVHVSEVVLDFRNTTQPSKPCTIRIAGLAPSIRALAGRWTPPRGVPCGTVHHGIDRRKVVASVRLSD